MERLSGLDASFLYLETPAQLMHVNALVVLDPSTVPGGYDFATMKAAIQDRVRNIPTFRRRIQNVPLDLDHPFWVDDDEFDIDRHVDRLALPAPGGRAELEALCGELAGFPLDRNHPLWSMSVIEGLEDGRIAVFTKMHHAGVDGVAGADLFNHLCSLEPGGPALVHAMGQQSDPSGPDPRAGERIPGALGLLAGGVWKTATLPWRMVGLVKPTTALIMRSIERSREGTAMAAPLTAPRTSFNSTISAGRVVAFTDFPLAEVKAIRDHFSGATINDIVLALSGGALRRFLLKRGELPEESLLVTVPVSVHASTHRQRGVNKVSSLFTRLGTDIADPRERIRELAARNRNAKEHQRSIPADTLQDWAEFAAPRIFGLAGRIVAELRLIERGPVIHNLVISNIPGPPIPLYFMDAKIEALYPLGPIFHGAGLNITVISNNGTIHVGLIGCREVLGDLDDLAADFIEELRDVEKAIL